MKKRSNPEDPEQPRTDPRTKRPNPEHPECFSFLCVIRAHTQEKFLNHWGCAGLFGGTGLQATPLKFERGDVGPRSNPVRTTLNTLV